MNLFWFWLKNTGILIPLLLAGMYLIWKQGNKDKEERTSEQKHQREGKSGKLKRTRHLYFAPNPLPLLQFYIPFLFCFVISNSMKLAPWEWDNIKVLIYWFVGSIPFVAFALAWIYNQGKIFRFIAAACLFVLIAAGASDVFRVVTKQINYGVFEPDAIRVAEQIKAKTAPDALFLNAPTFNTAVVLSGRRSLLRYIGHLSSHGIDYNERETDLKRIYEGNATADIFLKKHGIEYVLISPEERAFFKSNSLPLNEAYFQKYPVVAESGEFKVYKVK